MPRVTRLFMPAYALGCPVINYEEPSEELGGIHQSYLNAVRVYYGVRNSFPKEWRKCYLKVERVHYGLRLIHITNWVRSIALEIVMRSISQTM